MVVVAEAVVVETVVVEAVEEARSSTVNYNELCPPGAHIFWLVLSQGGHWSKKLGMLLSDITGNLTNFCP